MHLAVTGISLRAARLEQPSWSLRVWLKTGKPSAVSPRRFR